MKLSYQEKYESAIYTVYKITNIHNGKIYVGAHKTDTPMDEYLGSGNLIKRAVKKYGRKFFVKDILAVYDNSAEAYEHEASIVTKEFVLERTNYNMCLGGAGGFTPESMLWWTKIPGQPHPAKGHKHSDSSRQQMSENRKGMKFSEEHCRNIGISKTGIVQTDETKAKRAASLNYTSPNAKKITVNGITYKSIDEAEKTTGISRYLLRQYRSDLK